MKKKLSKVLAVVLSLVLAVGLAAVDGASVAQAAKKAKKLTLVDAGDLNVTSGETRTIKIKGNKAKKAKWSVKGDGASYVSLNKTKGKKVKMTVADNATGTVKVVAKLTKKNKVTVTYTLSCEATAITLADAEGYTNEAIALATTVTPSNATPVDVTYAVYTDEAATTAAEKATVADGALTATEAGTYYVVATAGTLTSNIAKVVVTDKLAQVTGVKQTRKNVIEVTFDADASKVTDDEVVIENELGVRVNVKKITLDDAKTTATIETLVNMADGKVYTVTYGETNATFTATTGEVASVGITPDVAPVNTPVEVKAQLLDVNGVILDEIVYGKTDAAKYEFTVEIAEGGQTDESKGQIIMDTEGAVANVTVVYHTGELDANDEEIVFEAKASIKAIAAANISGYDTVKFVTYDYVSVGETCTTLNNPDWLAASSVRVGGLVWRNRGEGAYYIAAIVKDDDGYTRVDGSLTAAGYTLSSADDTYLLVDGDKVIGVREGKTYVLVSDKDGNVIFTIPVTIEAASQLKSITVDKTTVYLTAGDVSLPSEEAHGRDSATIGFAAKDQYGEDYEQLEIEFAETDTNDASVITATADRWAGLSFTAGTAENPKVATSGAVDAKGWIAHGNSKTNSYTLTVKDTNSDATCTKKVYAKITQPKADAASIKLAVDSSVDTTVYKEKGSHLTNQAANVKLGVYDSMGTLIKYDYLPSGSSVIITKAGKVVVNAEKGMVKTASAGYDAVTAPAILTYADDQNGLNDQYFFVTRVRTADADGNEVNNSTANGYIKKIETGNYTVKVTNIKFDTTTKAVKYVADSTAYLTATVAVKDAQKGITVGQDYKTTTEALTDANAVALNTLRVEASDADANYVPQAEGQKPYIINVLSSKLTNNALALTKVEVAVPYSSDVTDVYSYIKQTMPINYTVKAAN